MLQQEVDRLIDFVINNNIKTKTIKNLGKARFKKTTLETLQERDARVATEEVARKLAEAEANKNKIPPAPNDPSPDLPLSLTPDEIIANTPLPYDSEFDGELDKGEAEAILDEPPEYKMDKYPEHSMYGILEKYYPQDEEMRAAVESLGMNLVMNKAVFDEFVPEISKRYVEDGDLGDIGGTLAYICKSKKFSAGPGSRRAVFIHDGQKQEVPLYRLKHFKFVLAGVYKGIDVYMVTNTEGHPKTYYQSSWANPKWDKDLIVTHEDWQKYDLQKTERGDLSDKAKAIWGSISMGRFIGKANEGGLDPVSFFKVAESVRGSGPLGVVDETIEDDADDQRGGWIWLLA